MLGRGQVGALTFVFRSFVSNPECAFDYGKATLARFKVRKCRQIEICAQSDKIIQEAVRMVVERLYEARFSDQSLGCRPGTGRQLVFRQIKSTWNGIEWYLQFQILHCVHTVNHIMLTKSLTGRIRDQRLLELIKQMSYYPDTDKGIRRNILTSLLCNIYLNYLDKVVQRVTQVNSTPRADRLGNENIHNIKYIRYLDQLLLGIEGPQELVRHLRDHISDYITKTLKLEVHTQYDNIIMDSPKFLGIEISCETPDMVRNAARDMEKRRRCKVNIMKQKQIKEGAYENKVGFLFEQAWLSNAKKAIIIAEETVNQLPSRKDRGLRRITALNTAEFKPEDKLYTLAQHVARLNRMIQGFFTTRRPAAQDQYMIRKHLRCLPSTEIEQT